MVAARSLLVDRWTAEVIGALQAAGLRPVLLKGPAIARWLYADDPTARPYVDVDVLVGPTEIEGARSVLSRLGFVNATEQVADDIETHADEWGRARDGAAVDLHRTLHGCEELSDADVWAAVTAAPERLDVAGVVVEVPGAAFRTLHVVLHVRTTDGPGRQRWSDLSRAVEQVDRMVWEEAAQLARALGVDGEMGTTLRMINPALADDLELVAPAPARLFLRHEGTEALSLARLGQLKGVSVKARYIRQKLLPPPAFLRERISLANSGRLGLLCAYPLRLAWCLIRLPAGTWGWLRARRHHRQNLERAALPPRAP